MSEMKLIMENWRKLLKESPLSTAVSAVHSTIDKSDPVKKLERVAAGLADVHGYARMGQIDQVADMREEVQLKILAFVEAAGRIESTFDHGNTTGRGHYSPRLGRVKNKLREYIPHIVMAFSEIKQPIVLPALKKSEILDAFGSTLYAKPEDDAWVRTIKFE
tara:strand:- start:6062 stop:6547 length:486 start_codon:yes stop_codon:yes gene_type:complete